MLVLGLFACGGSSIGPSTNDASDTNTIADVVGDGHHGDDGSDLDTTAEADSTEGDGDAGNGDSDTLDDAPDGETPDAETDVTVGPPENLFVLGPPVAVELLVDNAGLASLQETPSAWVPATATIHGWSLGESSTAAPQGIQVEVRLGGEFGGARPLTEKAYFVLRFSESFAGLQGINLNNNVRNRAQVRAQITYAMARSFGVPAPRATWAWVTVNGAVYGLYGLEEDYVDSAFTDAWWPEAETEMYRTGTEYGDLVPWQSEELVKLTGKDLQDRSALDDLVAALEIIEDEVVEPELFEALAAHFDMDAYIDFAALEIYVAHTEGSAIGRRQHVLVRNLSTERWHYAVAGGERAFRNLNTPWAGNSQVHKLCLRSLTCRKRLGERLAAIVEHGEGNGILGVAQSACAMVNQHVASDPMLEASPGQVAASCNQTLGRLVGWAEALPYNLACADPPSVDHDGDGYSGCTDDCNDEDETVNPGAPEACNLVDDDCSGAIDDVDMCAKCVAFTSTVGVDYDLCFEPKSWQDGRDFCVDRGGDLASIHGDEAQTEVKDAAFDVLFNHWWMGLTDASQEGVWAWSDGTPYDYTHWNQGEPNDSNGEDCAHVSVWGDGSWNDINCNNTYPVICQYPDASQ